MLLNRLIKIDTERLLIRVVAPCDLPALLEINSKDEITRYVPYKTWVTTADSVAWLERMEKLQAAGGVVQMVIVERQSQQVIGACLLFAYDEASSRAEIGYVLGRPYWGQGLMIEAIDAVVKFGFEQLGLRRLEATVDPRNAASLKLIERLGFSNEGTRRQRVLMKGMLVDQRLYGLLQDEWRVTRHRAPGATG